MTRIPTFLAATLTAAALAALPALAQSTPQAAPTATAPSNAADSTVHNPAKDKAVQEKPSKPTTASTGKTQAKPPAQVAQHPGASVPTDSTGKTDAGKQ